ncbi:hypothetical protein TREPR_1549 [Treponema primitia ZAS-2]|uniref:PucR C-terminal helix-turn-helix domain-containing protein n=1 Tax=Treponema primitia (strain ATCC BAA-887 / DSM 12427 / ZAS-2) TaxID=545694 RepID=F5YPF1_TREPZ|nr:helix-turn-helix domain-containing protein [Treponema primitia]AEF85575.1 hypothetical protein TREPR_1549 [Treponema primitia ZAS-2]
MRISADILFMELSGRFTVAFFGNLNGELTLERPQFLRDGTVVKDDQIYICDANTVSAVPDKKTRSILLYMQPNTNLGTVEKYFGLFEAIFTFRDVLPLDIYDIVQNIYSRFDKWDADLLEALNHNRDIQAMLDASDNIFNNPLILHDNYYKVISFSKKYTDAFPRMPYILQEKDADHIDLSEYDIYSMQRAVLFPTSITGVRSLYVNIFQKNRLQYRLLVLEYSRKFNPSDSALLEHLAERVQPIITGSSADAARQMVLPNIIRNILIGEFTDAVSIKELLGTFNWIDDYQYVCMKVFFDSSYDEHPALSFIEAGIKEIIPEACVFEYDAAVAVFINMNDMGENIPDAKIDSFDGFSGEKVDRFSVIMGTFLINNNLKAGISDKFSGFDTLKLYYRQAELALKAGNRSSPLAHLYYFKNIVKSLILDFCAGEFPPSMICSPELIKLRDYDRKHKADLFRTLLKYLENHLNITGTAIELSIHRSTLTYRLERIREISGLNIEDSSNQWYLLLSFKLLELDTGQE